MELWEITNPAGAFCGTFLARDSREAFMTYAIENPEAAASALGGHGYRATVVVPPAAPKHEHEWAFGEGGPNVTRYRIAWREERKMFWPQVVNGSGEWEWDYDRDNGMVYAAGEIARLAGLTPPANEKGEG